MDVTEAWDGEWCTAEVFAHGQSYYSIIIVSSSGIQDPPASNIMP